MTYNNKVETLRAICFTKEDLNDIKNDIGYSDLEIEFMVEFKKIYELGIDQLKKFIDKLIKEGKDLDTYTIEYYMNNILNGPFGANAKAYADEKDYKEYFEKRPDTMGRLGNAVDSPQNTSLMVGDVFQLLPPVDLFNKTPLFMQDTLIDAINATEKVYRESIRYATLIDNTLPCIDKANNVRKTKEPKGEWQYEANGSYLVKDKPFRLVLKELNKPIFEKVKDYLGDENFRLFSDNKSFSPFDTEKNSSKTENTPIEKEYKEIISKYDANSKSFTDVEETVTIFVDLLGDVLETDDKRAVKIKVPAIGDGEYKEYILNTNEGQLGDA